MQHGNPPRNLTAEDLYALPDLGTLHELSAGTLLSEPPPGGEHGRVEARLLVRLGAFVERERLGETYAGDTGFILARSPDTVRAPDLAFVNAERARAQGKTMGPMPMAPDLAVEILSPHDRPRDIQAKVADYLAAGTRLVWLVDPATQRVCVCRSRFERRWLGRADELDGEDVVRGFRVKVSDLFGEQ